MAPPPSGGGPPYNKRFPPPGVPPDPPKPETSGPVPPYVGNFGSGQGNAATFHIAPQAQAGNGLVIFVNTNGSSLTSLKGSDQFGSVYITPNFVTSSNNLYWLYCPLLLGSNPNVTLTCSGSPGSEVVWFPIVGQNPNFFLDGWAWQTGSAHILNTGLTTLEPNSLVVAAGTYSSSNTANTWTAPYRHGTVAGGVSNLDAAWSPAPLTSGAAGPQVTWAGGTLGSTLIVVAIRTLPNYPSHRGLALPILPPGVRVPVIPHPDVLPAGGITTTPVSALGVTSTQGTALLTASGSLAAFGVTPTQGTGALTGSGALAALAVTLTTGTAELDPQLQALGVSETTGTAQLTGTGALATLALTVDQGTGSLTGSGALDALALTFTAGTADLEPAPGAGALSALGLSSTQGTATLTGSGALSALGLSLSQGTADLEPLWMPGTQQYLHGTHQAAVSDNQIAASQQIFTGSIAASGSPTSVALAAFAVSVTSSYAQLTGAVGVQAFGAMVSAGTGDLEPFVPFVPPVTPPPAGSVPGWDGPPLATGMGPYKRPDQIFGERDPISPYLSSRAATLPPAVPAIGGSGHPFGALLPDGNQSTVVGAQDELALLLLLALEETAR